MNTYAFSESAAPERIRKLAAIAQGAALAGFALLVLVLVYMAYLLVAGGDDLDLLLRENLGQGIATVQFTRPARIVGCILAAIPISVGLYALWCTARLFAGYRRGEIMTETGAQRLSRIGWTVLALGPISVLSATLAALLVPLVLLSGEFVISIGLEDTDVFAVVFGLLLVVVGRILSEAARISEEHRSFV